MTDSVYKDIGIKLNRIYTKSGDGGDTRLVGGTVVSKDNLRIEVYGIIDELNSAVGLSRVSINEASQNCQELTPLSVILLRIQHELFNLGSILATEADQVGDRQPRIVDADVEQLEYEIDRTNAELTNIKSFVLPGGCRANAELHLCRTICRRAERYLVALKRDTEIPDATLRYLNRLSDAFFVWSRWVSLKVDSEEVLWQPNQSASGQEG